MLLMVSVTGLYTPTRKGDPHKPGKNEILFWSFLLFISLQIAIFSWEILATDFNNSYNFFHPFVFFSVVSHSYCRLNVQSCFPLNIFKRNLLSVAALQISLIFYGKTTITCKILPWTMHCSELRLDWFARFNSIMVELSHFTKHS